MKDCCSPDIQNALAQVVASLKRQDGTTRLRDKSILYWAPPICQVRCQVFYLHRLSLILMTLQESLYYRQVIGESEKLDNFCKAWNGAEPR